MKIYQKIALTILMKHAKNQIQIRRVGTPLCLPGGWESEWVWVMSECLVQHDDAWVEVRWPGLSPVTFPATFPATFPVDRFAPKIKFSRLCGLGLVSSVFQLLF
ncbi:hypothetical protein DY000_02047644 [Brassica cretica]|uniref:Uncharacterized protein n=1 Tax=Brassica cretica TaxID=69181 RepID=A0ABQ7F263_BRACR|nr:hypothetical protein DY000_02047644 [Brassica cretica]